MQDAARRTVINTLGAAFVLSALVLPCELRAVECAGDPTRTVFASGDGQATPPAACRQFDGNAATCLQAFHIGNDGIASCFYDASEDECLGCGTDHNENEGNCTNTCAVTPTCAGDPTRTDFVGGQGEQACHEHDGNQAGCLAAFHQMSPGGFASCWYDTNNNSCRGCGPSFSQGDQLCTNTCVVSPVCAEDPERTIFAGGPGDGRDDPRGACRQFDDEPQMCNQAYHLGGDGIYSSCFPTIDCRPCGDSRRGDATAPVSGGAAEGRSNNPPEIAGCINSCVKAPTCADATRTTFAGGPDTGSCHTFDGDPTACNAAFHLGENGVATCWYDAMADECSGCGPSNEGDGDCTNTCIANECPLDSSRTTFAGGPFDGQGGGACRQYTTQGTCEAAFHRGRDGIASCYWDGSDCFGCGESNEEECVNTCAGLPRCIDATRTNFLGGDGSEACREFDGDQAGCLAAYHESDTGLIASCWYDTDIDGCRGCGPKNEIGGVCTNTCQPTPTCAQDSTRTIFVGGPDTDACETFDDDQLNCEKAFHRSRLGIYASCFFDDSDGDCRGCGPRNQSDGDCTNTCGPAPTCPNDATLALGECEQFDGNPNGCGNAFEATPEGPVSCVAVPLCEGCGLSNQDDEDCTNTCEGGPQTGPEGGPCDDGIDNDQDDATDCGDTDCVGDPACAAPAPALSWPGMLAALLGLSGIALYRMRPRKKLALI